MSLEHMLRDEQEAWRFLLGEEFGMKHENFERNKRRAEEILAWAKRETEKGLKEQAWRHLQAVPSYIETQAAAWAAELSLPIEQ